MSEVICTRCKGANDGMGKICKRCQEKLEEEEPENKRNNWHKSLAEI